MDILRRLSTCITPLVFVIDPFWIMFAYFKSPCMDSSRNLERGIISLLILFGFTNSKSDSSLFIYRQGDQTAYLLLYVDDIALNASSPSLLQQVITTLRLEFAMSDLGTLNYFLGIVVT